MAWLYQEGSTVALTKFPKLNKEFQARHGDACCNPSTWEAEAGGWQVLGQCELPATSCFTLTEPPPKQTHSNFRNYGSSQAELSFISAHSGDSPAEEPTRTTAELCSSGLLTEDIFSSYCLLKKNIVTYEETDFYYLVKIKFCKITS